MRLSRMIALSSELSRRASEKAIIGGRVSVNGRAVTKVATVVDPARDGISLDGHHLHLRERRNYVAFNKPARMLVTKSDPLGRPTIWDHLEEWKAKLNSVGRLDYDSEGLILLSDDGDFINRLTHPRHEVSKIYRVRVKGEPTASDLNHLKTGVALKNGKTLPAKVRRIDAGGPNALIEIGIREGKNRQLRRMFEKIGFRVMKLRRMSVGPVELGRLKPGQWRFLKTQEICGLIEESNGHKII